MERNANEPQGIAAQMKAAAGMPEVVRDRAGQAVEAVRGTTGNLQAIVADLLDDSARTLHGRARGQGEVALAVALERSAMWLRENDLTELRAIVRTQLRDHPGRTALLALGAGVLIGRASRR
jgi:hypothetical protein